jgi:hypothetical protein
VSPWQAGLNIHTFPGATLGEQVANAAGSIGATILSPAATADNSPVPDPTESGYVAFTTKAMIDQAHKIGLRVIPWTVSRLLVRGIRALISIAQVDDLNIAEQLLDWKADGLITDFTTNLRLLVESTGLNVRPPFDVDRVNTCLAKHLQLTSHH